MYNFENSLVKIIFNPDLNAVQYRWKEAAETVKFRESLTVGLYLIDRSKASSWLFDFRDLGPLDKKDQIWLDNKWYPKAIELGIRRMAIIPSEYILDKFDFVENNNLQEDDCITQLFFEEDEALQWLEKHIN